ncbi:MAG: NADH-quinone oxidoreductase subunit NuoE [Bacteroidales bacterium]|jgi:NADH-quinone oxidoreductase subunit E|nr:NADH-quinone oxidoreductase subunit NuoE [Bacteroidales bacterium]
MRISRIEQTKTFDVQNDEVDLSLLDPIIEKYKNKRGIMIPLLQSTQNLYGYLPKQAFPKLSKETGLDLSDMFGVASFYAQFRLSPVGKYIVKVCHGTACHVQGAKALTEVIEDSLKIKDGETTEDRLFTLESVACLGCCSLAPVIMINEETYGNLDGKGASKIIRNIRLEEKTK